MDPREMENISRGPTFGDFVTILMDTSMQDVTVAKSQKILGPLPLQEMLYSVTEYTVQF
jgi:hypothetical protein